MKIKLAFFCCLLSCITAGTLHEAHGCLQKKADHFRRSVVRWLWQSSGGEAASKLPITSGHLAHSQRVFLRRRAGTLRQHRRPHHALQPAAASEAGISDGIPRRRRARRARGEESLVLQRGWNIRRDAVRWRLARMPSTEDLRETDWSHLTVPETGLIILLFFLFSSSSSVLLFSGGQWLHHSNHLYMISKSFCFFACSAIVHNEQGCAGFRLGRSGIWPLRKYPVKSGSG